MSKAFERRGYLEGFYGKPWTDAQRRDMVALMAKHGMNCYAYGAKDDPYHRDHWEELYPEEALRQLQGLVAFCLGQGVDFIYCAAPGLTYDYTCEEHYEALFAKLRQVRSLGVRSFGLFFDDIPDDRQSAEDHAAVANRVFKDMPGISLTVCPMVYHGRGNEAYIRKIGHALERDIDLFWTGSNICSQWIYLEEAELFRKNTRRAPLYWDNFPVNDAEMFQEMHLGPIQGRDPELPKCCRGILFNGMEYFECTKVAFLTCADYLRDPESYNPERSWLNALDELFGEEGARRFLPFGEMLLTSCLRVPNCPRLNDALETAVLRLRKGEPRAALETLRGYYARLEDCRAFLAGSEHPMVAELGKWIRKFNHCCDIFALALKLFEGEPVRGALAAEMEIYNDTATVLTDFGFRAFVETALEKTGEGTT
jgi:hyaluronoglucosaminidase